MLARRDHLAKTGGVETGRSGAALTGQSVAVAKVLTTPRRKCGTLTGSGGSGGALRGSTRRVHRLKVSTSTSARPTRERAVRA